MVGPLCSVARPASSHNLSHSRGRACVRACVRAARRTGNLHPATRFPFFGNPVPPFFPFRRREDRRRAACPASGHPYCSSLSNVTIRDGNGRPMFLSFRCNRSLSHAEIATAKHSKMLDANYDSLAIRKTSCITRGYLLI